MRHKREILAIALPAIVSNITTPVLGLVDVAVTGHIGAAVYIAAIAVGGSMFNMLYWLFNFLRMGTTGLTAQLCGKGDATGSAIVLYRSLAVGLFLGFAMIALQGPLASGILRFMDADRTSEALAARYFSICIWGAPAVMLTYGISGWFLGMQNSRAQMWMAIVTNLVNIAVSLSLVFWAGWKIEGVATGTLTAQWVGLLVGIVIIIRKYHPKFPGLSAILNLKELSLFFRINSDIFLRTTCLVAVTLWFTHAGAIQGTDILAANAMLLQLFMLFSFFMDGFAFAGEALSGKFFGAGQHSQLKSVIGDLMKVGLQCALAFGIIYALFGDAIMKLLAKDPSVLSIAHRYLVWAIILPLCGFMAFVWDGIFVGLVRTRAMLISMACALCIFFALYFALRSSMGNDALWIAFDAYLLTRGICLWIIYRKGQSAAPSR